MLKYTAQISGHQTNLVFYMSQYVTDNLSSIYSFTVIYTLFFMQLQN